MNISEKLLTDKEWTKFNGDPLIILKFDPLFGSRVENGIVESPNTNEPYASITFERFSDSDKSFIGFITHRDDFKHLWEAFQNKCIIAGDCVIVIYWTAHNYKFKIIQLISNLLLKFTGATPLPKCIVLCISNDQLLFTVPLNLIPNEDVQLNIKLMKPLKFWIPEIIE